jgi:hypothetical protein
VVQTFPSVAPPPDQPLHSRGRSGRCACGSVEMRTLKVSKSRWWGLVDLPVKGRMHHSWQHTFQTRLHAAGPTDTPCIPATMAIAGENIPRHS